MDSVAPTPLVGSPPVITCSIWPPGGARSNAAARAIKVEWHAFAAWLAEPLASSNKHEQAFAPLVGISAGKGGRVAAAAAAGHAGIVALEYDATATAELLARALEVLAGFDAVIYTSASATPECPRFRIVVRPSRPVGRDEYAACVARVGELLGVPPASESRQITRIWYRPITGARSWVFTGHSLDVDAAVAAYPPPAATPRVTLTPEELDRYSSDERAALAWAALDRRRPDGMFAAALVCRDHGVDEPVASALVDAYARALGWAYHADEVVERVEHAYSYARGPVGSALPERLIDREPVAPAPAAIVNDVLIVGPYGSGKTTAAIAAIRHRDLSTLSAVWIVPRARQAADTHARTGFHLYGEDGDRDARRLVVTLKSSHKYAAAQRDIVVIDEASVVLREIGPRTWAAIASLCRTAKFVLVLGADVDRLQHDVLRELTGRALPVHRMAALPMHRTWRFVHPNALRRAVCEAAPLPGCKMLVWDVRDEMLAFGDHLRALGHRVATFAGKGGRSDAVPTDNMVAELDYLLCNHAVAEQISIVAPIAKVFGLFKNRIVPPHDRLQLCMRARNVIDPEIVIAEPAWRDARVPTRAEICERIGVVVEGGDPHPTGAMGCRLLREIVAAEARARPSLRSWLPRDAHVVVDATDPGPFGGDIEVRERIKVQRLADATRTIVAPPMWTLPVRPSPEQIAGKAHARLIDHGLPADVATAVADRDGRMSARVERAALRWLAELGRPGRAAFERICELEDDRVMAGRRGLAKRAALDLEFAQAWAADPDRDWRRWAHDRRRRLEALGFGLPPTPKPLAPRISGRGKGGRPRMSDTERSRASARAWARRCVTESTHEHASIMRWIRTRIPDQYPLDIEGAGRDGATLCPIDLC